MAYEFEIGTFETPTSYFGSDYLTWINILVPATKNGTVKSVKFYIYGASNVLLGTMEKTGSSSFTTRDYVNLGYVSSPGTNTVDVELDVKEGDYMAIYCRYMGVKQKDVGYSYYYKGGNYINVTDTVFSLSDYDNLQIPIIGYADGTGLPVTFNDATISKWNDTTISKWNGVG